MKFKEWFSKKITVGSFPLTQNNKFDPAKYQYVINVSDEFYSTINNRLIKEGCKTFWFPMNECKKDIGLNSIYGAMNVLYQAEKENATVYLHCHAGINRSPLIWAAYHYMRSGKHLIHERSGFLNRLYASCARGYLPPLAETEKYLSMLNKFLEKEMLCGGILDQIKMETINNF